jgi:anti-sigma B factor antagonist
MTATDQHAFVEDVSRAGIVVLRVDGRLDAQAAPALLARCAQIQHKGQKLVLDLSGVTFLSSSGVGAMLVLSERFREHAAGVRFAALSETARVVIDLLDLGRHLAIDTTVQDAVTAVEAKP